ncbi:hypothetical protein BY458DRAFT_487211 [Sporodiniella umbellata]|nr:hypothetical protein BY458DRAFT_487211 [Sporodiniella umbellata]
MNLTNPANKELKRTKRPRAPIACYRCHHKKARLLTRVKVRCDGIHPNCTRCLSSGILCAYPSSRRSRNTQPVHADPFIHHLSQLEGKIQRMEDELDSQRTLVQSIVTQDTASFFLPSPEEEGLVWPVEKETFSQAIDAMILSLNDPGSLFMPDFASTYDSLWLMENH